MSNGERPNLGDKIVIEAIWTKKKFWGLSGFITKWERKSITPVEGVYIGRRQVYNGDTFIDEDGACFNRSSSHNFWLVVLNERENPVHVSPVDTDWMPF